MDKQLIETIEVFLNAYYKDAIAHLTLNYPQLRSLYVNFFDIDKYNVELSHKLLDTPDVVLEAFNTAARNLVGKEGICVRIANNPYKIKIGDIRFNHVRKLLSFDGLVLKTTEVRPKLVTAAFQCPFCAHVTYLPQTSPKRLTEPAECEESSGGCGRRISKFILLADESTFTDSQKIRLQESLEELRGGDVPRTKDAELEGDLTGIVSPGDRIIVNGILRSEIKITAAGKSPVFDVFIEANAIDRLEKVFEEIKITEDDEREIIALSQRSTLYDDLIANMAPSIYGLQEVKEALLLQLFTGIPKTMADGTTIRGDIHVLLVGDPGLAKSQLLTSVANIAPRGLLTSGSSSTAAGLTAAAVRDEFSEGAWSLEAGALVLADMGLCACISEGQNVITPTGLTQIENMKPNDSVMSYSKSGPIIQLVKYVIDKGMKQTMVLFLYDGSRIECTPDHKLLTSKGWKQAEEVEVGDLFVVPANYDEITVRDKDEFEKGFLHGFGLSDIYMNEKSPKNGLSFAASSKNGDRTQYITTLLKRQYDVLVGSAIIEQSERTIQGRTVHFGSGANNWFSSKKFKNSLRTLFEHERLPSGTIDFKVGFLAGILSTDCSISHKKGANGIKHEIDITLGRKKYSDEWLDKKMSLVNSIFYELGIMSVIRKRKILITSLLSYNRVVDIFASRIVGKKKEQLYSVAPIMKIPSYDCYLNGEYSQWFASVKFNTSMTVKMGLHSRIYGAQKKGIVTTYIMDTLKPHWSKITKVPFKDYKKTYLLNRVQKIEQGSIKRVYDLTLEGEHNFMVEGCTVHNCDELDKMSKQDRGALHEAIEQQRVSVAKAGIVASLHSRCAFLAAANPIQGRFDPYEPIAKQINMPPTLLSRFDLIFIMLDKTDNETDSKLAQFVLETHKRGEAMQKLGETKAEATSIPPLLLRKYIAYSRNVVPQMSDVAIMKFKNFYTGMRQDSRKEDAAIPITVRQLESLVRLGEARARTRLSDTVTEEDADVVLKLFLYCMRSVYTDPESGHIDVDWVVAGTSKTKRDRGKTIRDIMQDLEKQSGSDIPALEVVTIAETEGITREKAEEVLEMMKRDGIIFSPTQGVIKFVR